jgi:hypothetical protein
VGFVKFGDLHFGQQFDGWRFWGAVGWDLNVGMLEYSRAILGRFNGDSRAILGRLSDLHGPPCPLGEVVVGPYQPPPPPSLKKKKKKNNREERKKAGQDNMGGRLT